MMIPQIKHQDSGLLERIKVWLDMEYTGRIDANLKDNELIVVESNKTKSAEEQLNEIMEDEVLKENLDILDEIIKKHPIRHMYFYPASGENLCSICNKKIYNTEHEIFNKNGNFYACEACIRIFNKIQIKLERLREQTRDKHV